MILGQNENEGLNDGDQVEREYHYEMMSYYLGEWKVRLILS